MFKSKNKIKISYQKLSLILITTLSSIIQLTEENMDLKYKKKFDIKKVNRNVCYFSFFMINNSTMVSVSTVQPSLNQEFICT